MTMPAYRAEATLARTAAQIPPDVADKPILVDNAGPDNAARLACDLGIAGGRRDRSRLFLGFSEPDFLGRPEVLGRALHLAGLRMVEWLAPRLQARARVGIAVARPAVSAIPGRRPDGNVADGVRMAAEPLHRE